MWNCAIDDPRFGLINKAQWIWYAEMLYKEKVEEAKEQINLAEYIASFWNSEAVKKIKEARKQTEQHKFATDEEFENQIKTEEYKNSPIVQALKKIREADEAINAANLNNIKQAGPKKIKMPTDLEYLATLDMKRKR